MEDKQLLYDDILKAFTNYGDFLGIKIHEICDGHVTLCLDLQEYHKNIFGFAHGGVTASLLDHAAGSMTYYATGRRHVTRCSEVHYLSPFSGGRAYATAKPLRLGGHTALISAELRDEQGELLAFGSFEMYAV